MERSENNFEKAWKDLFDGAEAPPREDVWTKIESGLANRMLSGYRRKVLFYKLLAAASLVLAMGIGYFSYRGLPGGPDNGSASGELVSTDGDMAPPDAGNGEIPIAEIDDDERNSDEMGDAGEQIEAGITGRETNRDGGMAAAEEQIDEGFAGNAMNRTDRKSGLNNREDFAPVERGIQENQKFMTGSQEPTKSDGSAAVTQDATSGVAVTGQSATNAGILMPGSMDQEITGSLARKGPGMSGPPIQPGILERKKDPSEDEWYAIYEQTINGEAETADRQELWAGINFSSGIFDPNISYGNHSPGIMNQISSPDASYDLMEGNSSSFANFTKAVKPEETSFNSEVSFAYGIHVGYQINPRLVIRGGLSYINSNASTEISSYIDNPASNRKIAYQALNSVSIESAGVNTINQVSEEIRMNYSYEFISVPVSLGYYLIDKKFEWMVMAGISTDFFLKNTFSDENGLFDTTEIRAGEESPYHLSYLNGTFGTQVGMSFSERYRISLEPSYRLGLTEFTKESATGVSQPASFYITAGISYIFR